MPIAQFSRHAEMRARQRAVPLGVIDAILTFGDMEQPAGGGCTAVRISRRRLQDRELQSWLGTDWERAAGITIVVPDSSNFLVTVYRERGACGRPRRRRYT